MTVFKKENDDKDEMNEVKTISKIFFFFTRS